MEDCDGDPGDPTSRHVEKRGLWLWISRTGGPCCRAGDGRPRPRRPAVSPFASLPREGEAGHLRLHAGGREPGRFVRLQTSARSRRRQEPQIRRRKGHREYWRARLNPASDEAALEVFSARSIGALGVGPLPGDQQTRGRSLLHPLGAHRGGGARSGHVVPPLWIDQRRPALDRFVGDVRIGDRERQPAGVRFDRAGGR